MEDRYLFRGKRLDNGEWARGCLIICGVSGKHYILHSGTEIIESDRVGEGGCLQMTTSQVDPATVGQCTGLKDKHGKLIFEGDYIKSKYGVLRIDYDCGKDKNVCGFVEVNLYILNSINAQYCKNVKIVGNAYDNPEMHGIFY
ncbi:MAG: YopX family protein [Oscillospiraceae bacterium]|nr:YopX family protein [Oscillospiraceae bacterium]